MYSKRSLGSRAHGSGVPTAPSGRTACQEHAPCPGAFRGRLSGELHEHDDGSHRRASSPPATGKARPAAAEGEGSATRRRILQIALTLMAPAGRRRHQHARPGVGGRPQRGLALPLLPLEAGPARSRPGRTRIPAHGGQPPPATPTRRRTRQLATLLADILTSVLDVEDFVRLMLGEAIRGETTARAVGLDLFATFQQSMEEWVTEHRPDLDGAGGRRGGVPPACAPWWSGSSSSTPPACDRGRERRRHRLVAAAGPRGGSDSAAPAGLTTSCRAAMTTCAAFLDPAH